MRNTASRQHPARALSAAKRAQLSIRKCSRYVLRPALRKTSAVVLLFVPIFVLAVVLSTAVPTVHVTDGSPLWNVSMLSTSHDQHLLRVFLLVLQPQTLLPGRLSALVISLEAASYPPNSTVLLHVLVNREDPRLNIGSLKAEFENVSWSYGMKTYNEYESERTWQSAFISDRSYNESTVLVVADNTIEVAPAYYNFLQSAMSVVEVDTREVSNVMPNSPVHDSVVSSLAKSPVLTGAPVLAVALDSIELSGAASPGPLVRVADFIPSTAIFAPSRQALELFLRWYFVQKREGRSKPVLPADIARSFDAEEPYPGDLRYWFAHFVHAYGGHVLYPTAKDGSFFVDRIDTSGPGRMTINHREDSGSTRADFFLKLISRNNTDRCCNFVASTAHMSFTPESDLSPVTVSGQPSTMRIVPIERSSSVISQVLDSTLGSPWGDGDVGKDAKSSTVSSDRVAAVQRIAQFGRMRGNGSIAFTLVTNAFVETTLSWLCNVLKVGALPKALVFGVSGADVKRELEEFITKEVRISRGAILVEELGRAILGNRQASQGNQALDFGTSGYWLLMLERTELLRDVLDAGVGILHFETDQIWFKDPSSWIDRAGQQALWEGKSRRLVHDDAVDMVVTINTREEVSGNFFYLRPTLPTRHVWSLVTARFLESFEQSLKSSAVQAGKFHYIENDQSLLTKYVLGHVPWYNANFPVIRYAILDRDLFVDGTWYLDFEDKNGRRVHRRHYYTSKKSLTPVILNNNFMIGVDAKKRRAQRFGHWFWSSEDSRCGTSRRNSSFNVAVP